MGHQLMIVPYHVSSECCVWLHLQVLDEFVPEGSELWLYNEVSMQPAVYVPCLIPLRVLLLV